MSTMIERVVAANKKAWDEWPEPITFDNLPQVREAAARAAIAAMRPEIEAARNHIIGVTGALEGSDSAEVVDSLNSILVESAP